MNRWSKFWNFKPLSQTLALFHGRAFLCNIHILVLFLLLRTTEIRKKKLIKELWRQHVHSRSWCTLFTSLGNRWYWRENNAIQQWKTMGKISARVLLGGFIQQQFRLIPFMEKSLLRCKVDRLVRLHILLVTLHSPTSCEDEFFSEHFMYSNARGIHYYSYPLQIIIVYPFVLLWRTFPSLPPPSVGGKLIYIPIALTKAETARDTFFARFFFHDYLLNNNWQLNSYIICENFLQFNQERCTIFS